MEEGTQKIEKEGKLSQIDTRHYYIITLNTFYLKNIVVCVCNHKSYSFLVNYVYWLKYRRVYVAKTTDVFDLFMWAHIWKEEEEWFRPQELEQLLKLVECSLFIIINTVVGDTIWSDQGWPDFSINILAPSVGSWIKSYHEDSNHQRSSRWTFMDVTGRSALRGDSETSETITLREIANEAKERMMQVRMERMEK